MIFQKFIITKLFVLFSLYVFGQNTWEYYNKGKDTDEQIFNIEENRKGDILTTCVVYDSSDENKWYSVLRLHNNSTGKMEKESIYKIDSLSTKLLWIYVDNIDNKYTVIGSAYNKQALFRRGYFLLTQWDFQLNLLKDTLIKIDPDQENNYIWHISGSYALNQEFLVFANVRSSLDGFPSDGQQFYMRISKNGNIVKKKLKKESIFFAGQTSILEFKNQNYLLFGTETYTLDSDFQIVDSLIFLDLKTHIPHYHSNSRLFSDNKFLLHVENDDNQCPGLGIFDLQLNLIKKVNLCKSNIDFETGNINRCFDFIDTNSIFMSSKDVYFSYYSIAKVNSNLDVLWIKYFNNQTDIGQNISSIEATKDGGCILVGCVGFHLLNEYNLYSFGSWMKKFDKDGNTVSTHDPGSNAWEITVFPNPSTGDFKIDIAGQPNDTQLVLYDIQGREVKRYQQLTEGTNTFVFDDLPTGMYIWKLINKGREIGEGKWVKTGF